MAHITPYAGAIPIDELEGVEEGAFRVLHMDRETVMDQFDDVLEDTDARCRAAFACKGAYTSVPIRDIRHDEIVVEGGIVFASEQLARALCGCDELVAYAAVVHGHDELAKDPANSMFDSMFIDAWAAGYAMACHTWVKRAIDEQVRLAGRHVGRSWMPGEGDLPFDLQNALFDVLDVSRIGMQRSESGSVRPSMFVSGMRGVSDDPAIEGVGLDIPSFH